MKFLPVMTRKLLVAREDVTEEILADFSKDIYYDERACENCDGSRICEMCPNLLQLRFYQLTEKGNYVFCRGNLELINKYWPKFKDSRVDAPFKSDLHFTGTLRDYQQVIVNEWLKYKYGQIESPPRSGKTVLAIWLACHLRQKTLILAHQQDLLEQFYDDFLKLTSLKDTNRAYGRQVVTLQPKKHEIEGSDVVLATYQSFISAAGKKRLRELKNVFGFLIVDECHRESAPLFSYVTNMLNTKYRCGVSATPKRKDGLHIIADYILGPVTVVGEAEQMQCKVYIEKTSHVVRNFGRWTTFVNRLCNDTPRNIFILRKIAHDVKQGRYCLVTTARVKHALQLADILNKKGIPSAAFHGKSARRDILDAAKSGKIKVVVAMRQIVQLGITNPLWDTIHFIIPSANEYNIYQEVSRIRTPYKGKPIPIIRYYLDEGNKAVYSCFNIAKRVFIEQKFIDSGGELFSSPAKVKKLTW